MLNKLESGVYKWTNVVNGKVYVGSAKNVWNRRIGHLSDLRRGRHHSKRLLRAWRKYGEGAFVFQCLEKCPLDQLNDREQFWIDHYRAADPKFGYNILPSAYSCRGYKQTESHRAKVAEAVRKSWKDQKCRELKLSKLQVVWSNSEYRKRQSENTKRQMSDPEARRRISERCKGRKVSEETKQKLSETHKGFQWKKESKAKSSQTWRDLWSGSWGQEQRRKRSVAKAKRKV